MQTLEEARQGDPRVALEEDLEFSKQLEEMHRQIRSDYEDYSRYKAYADGNHSRPHAPAIQRAEVDMIRKRAVTNVISLAVQIPAQLSFCDGLKRGNPDDYEDPDDMLFPEEWKTWTRSRMQQKQTVAFTSALTYGQAFIALENLGTDDRQFKLLATRDTVAYYRDHVNDRYPESVLTIRSYPKSDVVPGLAVYYDEEAIVYLDFTYENEFEERLRIPHDLGHCPVARLTCFIDDEGRPKGIVEGLIPGQDRVNQTAFDLLSVQTFSAFKLRYGTGVEGEPVYHPETGEQVVDQDGNALMRSIPIDPSTFIQTENPEARFGTLDETELGGFLESLKLSIQHFAVQGQLPPHSLLGNLSNLSAETLVAAMSQTQRFAHVLKVSWGQTLLDLFELVALDMGLEDAFDEDGLYSAEPRWRDMSDNTMAATVDALGKASEMLGIPGRALWGRVPGATTGDVELWERMAEDLADEMYEDPNTFAGASRRERSGRDERASVPLSDGEPGGF